MPEETSRSLAIQPLWTLDFGAGTRSLGLAREKGWAIAGDRKDRLHLFSRSGRLEAQRQAPGRLALVAAADDGSVYVGAGGRNEIWGLAPDLSVRWRRQAADQILSVAIDPFGRYLAFADARGSFTLLDQRGGVCFQIHCPRPLYHLAFVPEAPVVIGCANYGLILCVDIAGRTIWRDGPVAHIGSLSLSGDGSSLILASYTDGLRRYNQAGQSQGCLSLGDTCRLAAVAFDGSVILAAGMSHRLTMLDRAGQIVWRRELESTPSALALGPLGEYGIAALANGKVVGFEVCQSLP
jgi:outer membrane protein assembly factor BamB